MNPEMIVRGAAVIIGLLFGSIGTGLVLATLGVFGAGAVSAEARWIGILAGLVFILGGLGAIVGYGIAGGAPLEDDTTLGLSLRVRIVQFLLGLGVAVSLAIIGTFVATGPGRSSVVAGLSCVALWAFVAVMTVTGIRRLTRQR